MGRHLRYKIRPRTKTTNGIQLLTYKLHDKFVFFGIAAVRILLWSNRSKHKWVKKSNLVGGLACLVTSASLCSTIAIATGPWTGPLSKDFQSLLKDRKLVRSEKQKEGEADRMCHRNGWIYASAIPEACATMFFSSP